MFSSVNHSMLQSPTIFSIHHHPTFSAEISLSVGCDSNYAGDGPASSNDGQTLQSNICKYIYRTTGNGNCLLEAFTVFLESDESPSDLRNRFCEEMSINRDCIVMKGIR
jgi:hypothetical protein